jgi:osmotically-inducible protein OsmY
MMDRRTVGAQTEDTEIQIRALNRIASTVKTHGGVSVTSYNRRVLLTGQVPDAATKRDVEQAVLPIPGLKTVYNELQVAPRATLATETRDAALTARIKASFLEQRELNANTVKVVTEGGVVYLLGLVTEREGKVYAGVASRVSGVQRVVTLFEYISEESLNRS